jgi:hypothetical protein
MSSWSATVQLVTDRADHRCEYCRMHQSLQGATFHIEHIIPSVRGGPSTPDNLALACPGCNLHKSDRVQATDPDSGQSVPLFNPRTQSWSNHFSWDGYHISGRTPVGRATALVLELNHPRRILIRKAEAVFKMFPP